MPRSRAYEEGLAAGKLESKTEFDNPYREGTTEHTDWQSGFEYMRGAGDTFCTS